MKNKLKLGLLIALVAVLAAGAAGAAVWLLLPGKAQPRGAQEAAAAAAAKPAPDYKYVTLDKVLVMLRGRNGEAVPHYMAVDIVFKAPPDQERRTKEHLPLLRTVAVKALSVHTVESASAMSVEDFAKALNKAYRDSYQAERREAPFVEALIGKLIIE